MFGMNNRSPGLHARAANLVRNLLTSHDYDVRYADANCKARVATLYLPLIGVLLDALPHLYDWNADGKGNCFSISSFIFKLPSSTPSYYI